MILAIETSTPVCSVALQTNDGRTFEKRIEGHGTHSERTFQFIDELLNRTGTGITDLQAVLFSNGPGSYTGLRIGASAVKGLLFGRNVPLYTFPTLLAFAAGVPLPEKPARIFSVIDARRNHLYLQQCKWDGSRVRKESEPGIKSLEEIEEMLADGDIIAGTGWERLSTGDLSVRTYGTQVISAKNLVDAWDGEGLKEHFKKEDPALFEPDYLNMAQVNNSTVGS